MRKARFKMVLAGLFATLTLMLLAVGSGQAQGLSTSITPKAGGTNNGTVAAPLNYLTAPQAMSVLENHTTALKIFLGTLIPGTQAYKTVETSYTYYNMIWSSLLSGKNVPDSIQTGLTLFQYPDYVNTPTSQIQALYAEALELLTI